MTKADIDILLAEVEGMRKKHVADCGRCNNCEAHVSSCEQYLEIRAGNKKLDDIKTLITNLFEV